MLQLNPYNRDALFNLAVTYLNLGQNDKVPPLVTRLVAVDPGNPENYLLAARAYVDIAKTRKGTAATAAVNDTTVSWFNRGQQASGRGDLLRVHAGREAARDRRPRARSARQGGAGGAGEHHVVRYRGGARGGSQEGGGGQGVDARPRPVTLKFEAIDKSGAVLGTQTVTTEALQPGKSAPFRVKIDAANAVAYRYTIAD